MASIDDQHSYYNAIKFFMYKHYGRIIDRWLLTLIEITRFLPDVCIDICTDIVSQMTWKDDTLNTRFELLFSLCKCIVVLSLKLCVLHIDVRSNLISDGLENFFWRQTIAIVITARPFDAFTLGLDGISMCNVITDANHLERRVGLNLIVGVQISSCWQTREYLVDYQNAFLILPVIYWTLLLCWSEWLRFLHIWGFESG